MDVMENIRLVLKKNMKALRKAKKLNQEQLAEKAEISISFLRDIERCESWVSPESLEAIARGLGVTVGDLFATGSEEKIRQYHEPVSMLAKKLLKVPDDVYEVAQDLEPSDEIWKTIREMLKQKAELISKRSNHA